MEGEEYECGATACHQRDDIRVELVMGEDGGVEDVPQSDPDQDTDTLDKDTGEDGVYAEQEGRLGYLKSKLNSYNQLK